MAVDKKWDKILDSIYYNPKEPAAFGSLQSLYNEAKSRIKGVSRKYIQYYLTRQDTYTLHRPVQKRFKKRIYLCRGLNDIWQSDLLVVDKLFKENGCRYLVVCIDTLSRQLHVEPVKRKTGLEVCEALKTICRKAKVFPQRFLTDRGTEYYNVHVKAFFKQHNIHHYSVHTEVKAGLSERVIRTLKSKVYKYISSTGSLRYIHVLDDFVKAYNSKPHPALPPGLSPSQVTKRNEKKVWDFRYKDYLAEKTSPFKYSVGQKVRISKYKTVFTKGYIPGYTRELFEIIDRLPTSPVTYRLKDENQEVIRGLFYERELSAVNHV